VDSEIALLGRAKLGMELQVNEKFSSP